MKTIPLVMGVVLAGMIAVPASADELRIGTITEATSIDPHLFIAIPNRQVVRSIFDRLIEHDRKGNLLPNLATSWKPVDDLTWEVQLRKGVKWHDGSPFTADDVAFTFNRIVNMKEGAGFTNYVAGKEVVKIDDHTIQIKTKKPRPILPREIAVFMIASKKNATGANADDFNTGKATIGTGPYKFVEWVRGDRIVFEANADHWGGKPDWDRVVYKPMSSNPSRVAALLNGDVDLIDLVPPQDAKRLEKDPGFVLHQEPSARVQMLWPDTGRDISPFVTDDSGKPLFPNPLRDQRVRKAMSLAIDRKAIVNRVLFGLAQVNSQLMLKGAYGYNPDMKPERYDPEAARKLLAEAGYTDKINLTIHAQSDRYTSSVQVCEAIAQMFARVGIKTQVRGIPDKVLIPKALNRELSMFYLGWGMTTGDPSSPMRVGWHTRNVEEGWGTWNMGRYSNDRLDAKIEEAVSTIDSAEREKVYQEAAAIGIGDLLWITLHNEMNTWASRKGVVYRAGFDSMTVARYATKAK